MSEKKFDDLREDGFYCNECSWLWSPHSMAPRNLAYGYATELKNKDATPHFGDLLQAHPSQTLERGIRYYLSGEIHHALACAGVVDATTQSATVRDAATRLRTLCEEVLSRYRDLDYWFATLQKEGRTPEMRRNSYHPVGDAT
jgi:hypothetical protein